MGDLTGKAARQHLGKAWGPSSFGLWGAHVLQPQGSGAGSYRDALCPCCRSPVLDVLRF